MTSSPLPLTSLFQCLQGLGGAPKSCRPLQEPLEPGRQALGAQIPLLDTEALREEPELLLSKEAKT